MINEIYQPKRNVRIVTATSLYDGHDASINIMRRILQNNGAEVIHLGHNRSVIEIVNAAIEEDVHAIAVTSYQGGHLGFFKFMIDLLKEYEAEHIKIFGGGGGVIIPEEIKELEDYGVTKIYSPDDGARMGLQGMINHLMQESDFCLPCIKKENLTGLCPENKRKVAQLITFVEDPDAIESAEAQEVHKKLSELAKEHNSPIIGITGTGGAGKSSLTDELVLRLRHDQPELCIAVISCDPSRRKTGGALLGDRIRMNSIGGPKAFMRSLATRQSATEISLAMESTIQVARAANFDLIIAETTGIGQGDSKISDIADVSIYVMTSEFGAAMQLEKIDMLDYADLVVINKFEKHGSDDALRDVQKQVQRNRNAFAQSPSDMPVFGTIAAKFNDDGVTALYHAILKTIKDKTDLEISSSLPQPESRVTSSKTIIIPSEQTRYLSKITETIRDYHKNTEDEVAIIRNVQHLEKSAQLLLEDGENDDSIKKLKAKQQEVANTLHPETERLLDNWQKTRKNYEGEQLTYQVRDKKISVPLVTRSLSHSIIAKFLYLNLQIQEKFTAGCVGKTCPDFFLIQLVFFL